MNELVDPFRDWDAAYLLGSLGMDDRRAYERHLLNCPVCTKAVGEIAGIPGILMKINSEDALALLDESAEEGTFQLHQSNVVQSLAKAAVTRKRRQRFVALSSVAAALLMVVGVGIGTHSSSPAVTGTRIAMAQLVPNSMTVNLRVLKKKWGTQITWDCTYAQMQPDSQSSEPYDLVVTSKSGLSTVVAAWSAVGKSAKGLVASTNIPLAQIKSIEVLDAGSQTPIVQGMV